MTAEAREPDAWAVQLRSVDGWRAVTGAPYRLWRDRARAMEAIEGHEDSHFRVVPVYFGSPPSRQPEPEDTDAFRVLLSAATSLADEYGVEIGNPDTYPIQHWVEWERLSHAVAKVSLAAGPSPSAGIDTNGSPDPGSGAVNPRAKKER